MARYIEEGHLKTVARAFTNQDFRDILDEVLEHTDSADVQPVVHGMWEDGTIWYGNFGKTYHICSVCKAKIVGTANTALDWKDNYCPNCGARMDGEE